MSGREQRPAGLKGEEFADGFRPNPFVAGELVAAIQRLLVLGGGAAES